MFQLTPKAGLTAGILLLPLAATAATATFEDLALAPESSGPGFTADGVWSSGGIDFVADWNETFDCCLSGFKYYSNRTDTSKVAFPDDDIATPGGGAGGSANYAIAFDNGARVEFAAPTQLVGVELTTTTITHDVIVNGDPFATPEDPQNPVPYVFGGSDGSAPDFFVVTITGLDAGDNPTGAVDFYLADYRFADDQLDYVVDDWTFVDLAALGVVSALELSFDGNVTNNFGLSTPTYLALDNLQAVPLPPAALLLGPALLGLIRHRHWQA